jgi:aspartyl-tRNA(Asn)/glutamyl-tRNA(Gln) amidotransferase subunit B
VAYAKALHGLVTWIGICDGNLQEGSFRVDANVSVRPAGSQTLGTRCEIKNLNSFRFLERAIQVEAARQVELIESGGMVRQETRLFDPERDETRSMRSKEDAHDYRYFPDPDLPPLVISQDQIDRVAASMPALPGEIRAGLMADYGLSAYDAATVTSSQPSYQYLAAGLAALASLPGGVTSDRVKALVNWIMGELASALNREDTPIEASRVSAAALVGLLLRVEDGTISHKIAREVFGLLWEGSFATADAAIEAKGLRQIQDTGAIQAFVTEVLAANPKMVEEYRAGKEKALNALVGQVMKRTAGKANPQSVTDLLKAQILG